MLEPVAAELAARLSGVLLVPERLGGVVTAGRIGQELESLGFRVLPVVGAAAFREVPLAAFGAVLADAGVESDLAERLHALYASVAPTRVRAVLVIEEAPHLDDASIAAIRQLVRASGVRAIVGGDELPLGLDALALDGRVTRLEELLDATQLDAIRLQTIIAGAGLTPLPTADLVWAARAAYDARDYDDAIRLASAAVDGAAERAEPAPVEALATLADTLSTTERLDEADAAYDAALAAAIESHEDDRLLELVFSMGAHWYIRRRDPDGAISRTERALALVERPELRARLTGRIDQIRFMAGRLVRGDGAAASLPPVGRPAAGTAITGMDTGGIVYRMHGALYAGALADLRATAEEARTVLRASPQQSWPIIEVVEFIDFLALVIDAKVAEAEAKANARRIATADDQNAIGMWTFATALTRMLAGDHLAAMRLAERAGEQLQRRDYVAAHGPCIALLATAAAQAGRTTVARYALETLGDAARSNVATDLQVSEALAWLHAADGDLDAAGRVVATAVDRALATSHTTYAALTASTAVRIGRPEAVLPQLRIAVGRAPEAGLAPIVLAHAEAAADRDPDALIAASRALADAGLLAAAADAAALADACGADGAAALAKDYRAGGSAPAALGAAEPLSRREREVVALAAQRLRNREIAVRLGLSERTVENYLANAFRKLGINRREELVIAVTP